MTFDFVGEKDGVFYDNGRKKDMKFFIKLIFQVTMISIMKFRKIYPSANGISSEKIDFDRTRNGISEAMHR
jgi:hypothetical protein